MNTIKERKKDALLKQEAADTEVAVILFAEAMLAKMIEKLHQGKTGWNDENEISIEELADMIQTEQRKPYPDPVDIANFEMMIWIRKGYGPGVKE